MAGTAILDSYGTKDFPYLHNDQAVIVYPLDFLDYPSEHGIVVDSSLEGVLTCIHNKGVQHDQKVRC